MELALRRLLLASKSSAALEVLRDEVLRLLSRRLEFFCMCEDDFINSEGR